MTDTLCPTCGGPVIESFEDSEEMTNEDFEKLALEHGIPLSVIRGKTKLSDHFSREYINFKCNQEEMKT
jgi:hypothetical protein